MDISLSFFNSQTHQRAKKISKERRWHASFPELTSICVWPGFATNELCSRLVVRQPLVPWSSPCSSPPHASVIAVGWPQAMGSVCSNAEVVARENSTNACSRWVWEKCCLQKVLKVSVRGEWVFNLRWGKGISDNYCTLGTDNFSFQAKKWLSQEQRCQRRRKATEERSNKLLGEREFQL